MPLFGTAPLQIEEMVAVERERTQQHDVRIHPEPAVLIKHRVAENVAEIADFRIGDDPFEQALWHDLVGGPDFDPVRPQELELMRRIAPHPHRVPDGPHRCGGGNEAGVLGGL